MEKVNVNIFELVGTNYEIGYHLGKTVIQNPQFAQMQKCESGTFTEKRAKEMTEMFDQYCPGLNEELQGFAEAIGTTRLQMVYYTLTYLTPGCSLLAALPKLTANGHVMVARNMSFLKRWMTFLFAKRRLQKKCA